jgi:hypothetical protein
LLTSFPTLLIFGCKIPLEASIYFALKNVVFFSPHQKKVFFFPTLTKLKIKKEKEKKKKEIA